MFSSNYVKDKNFLLLFFGSLVSGVGSKLHSFGIALFLLDLTKDASPVARYFSISAFILYLSKVIASTYTDRWNNKVRIIYLTDLGRGILYIMLGILVYYFLGLGNNTIVIVLIYTFLIFITLQTAFFSPSVSALIPQIIDKDELVSASSIFNITRTLQNMVGLFFGAILYIKFGIVPLMIVNGISFIFSGISEMFIKINKPKNGITHVKHSDERLSFVDHIKRIYSDLKAVVHYFFDDGLPILMVALIIFSMTVFVGPWFTVGDPYMIKTHFEFTLLNPEYLLASSEMVEAIAVILISLVIASISKRFKLYQLYRIGGVMFILLSFFYIAIIYLYDVNIFTEFTFITLFIVANFIAGCINATTRAPLSAAMHKYVDPRNIGKVVSMIDSFGGLVFPLTLLLTGFLIDNVSMYAALGMLVLGMVIITLISFFSKEVKKLV